MTNPEIIQVIHEEHLNIAQSYHLFDINRSSFYEQTQRNISPSERRRIELTLRLRGFMMP